MTDVKTWPPGVWISAQLADDAPERYDHQVVALAMQHGFKPLVDGSMQWWDTLRWCGREVADDWMGVHAERLRVMSEHAVRYLRRFTPAAWYLTEMKGLALIARCEMDSFEPSRGDMCPHLADDANVCTLTGKG